MSRGGERLNQVPDRTPTAWRETLRQRTIVAAAVLGLWVAVIECRLVFLQVVRHGELVAKATRQQMMKMDAAAKRGDILDRKGRVLATSVDADSIYAVPSAIENPEAVVGALCGVFGDCTAKERDALVDRLGKTKLFAYVRRQVSPDQARRVSALNLDGKDTFSHTQHDAPSLARYFAWDTGCSCFTYRSTTFPIA